MAKAKVLDNMVVIKSDVLTDEKLDAILMLNESLLKLKDEDNVKYEITKAEENTFSRFGAAFLGGETKGIITIPGNVEDRKAYVKQYITPVLVAINAIEEAVAEYDADDIEVDVDFV